MTTTNNRLEPGFWFGVLLIIFLTVVAIKCHAQTDTIPCKVENIQKYVIQPTASGKDKIFAVFISEDVSDIIYVPRTVYEYIELCKKNKVTPSIGIRFKNGVITSIVRYKKRYRIRHE